MKRILTLLLLSAAAALAQTPHTVALAWTWAQGTGGQATSFNVKRSTTAGAEVTIATVACPGTPAVCPSAASPYSYSDAGPLVNGTTYFYIVTATGPGGESGPTNESAAKIPEDAPSAPGPLTTTVH